MKRDSIELVIAKCAQAVENQEKNAYEILTANPIFIRKMAPLSQREQLAFNNEIKNCSKNFPAAGGPHTTPGIEE